MSKPKRHASFPAAVDAGASLIGSQNRLAALLGIDSARMANAKAGRLCLTAEQIGVMAELIDEDAHHLWELCRLNRLHRQNPFAHRN